jgi:hypothetical protein
MTARRLQLLGTALAALLAQVSCNPESGGTAGSGGATTTSSGGAGTGGSTGTTSTTTTTTTTMTGPITCKTPVSSPKISGKCDLLQQDCQIGETCVVTDDNKSTICRKGGGLKGPGKPCSTDAIDECEAGLVCVGPQSGIGFCTRPCCPDNDQPCGGGKCDTNVTYQSGLIVTMCSYSAKCTLFGPETCKNGQKCQFVYSNQGLAVCTIPAPNDVPDGGDCMAVNECSEASVCYLGKCHYNCKLDVGGTPGTGGCPAGQTCKPAYPEAAGNIGICL